MKKYVLVQILIIVTTSASFSQDTTWLSKDFKKIPRKELADNYYVLYKDKADTNKVKILSYTVTGMLQMERNFYPYYPKPVLNGLYRRFTDGKLSEERFYRNDLLDGHYKVFRENGLVRRDDLYQSNKFISGNCYGITGADTVWFEPQVPAKFPGGMDSLHRYIFRNMRYPYNAEKSQIQGRVIVSFTIEKDGSIIDVAVKDSVHPDLDKEAIRLISRMPNWIPGMIEGKPVKFLYRLPVIFRIE